MEYFSQKCWIPKYPEWLLMKKPLIISFRKKYFMNKLVYPYLWLPIKFGNLNIFSIFTKTFTFTNFTQYCYVKLGILFASYSHKFGNFVIKTSLVVSKKLKTCFWKRQISRVNMNKKFIYQNCFLVGRELCFARLEISNLSSLAVTLNLHIYYTKELYTLYSYLNEKRC